MAITNQQISYEYIADGNTNVFPFSCRVILASDLSVFVNSDRVTNFTVTGLDNDGGGNVMFDSSPAVGSRILIVRDVPLERETDYQTNGDFLAKTVNRDFDRIWMVLQSIANWFKRSLRYPVGGVHYNAQNRRIENLGRPTNLLDAVNKNYVDIGNNKLKQSIEVISDNMIQGFITRNSFEDGAKLTLTNEVLLYKFDGQYYRWTGDLPKIIEANSTPENSGGIGAGRWVLVGDTAIKTSIANTDDEKLGDAMIGVKQQYPGAVARTQHDKNSDIVCVFDFMTVNEIADSQSVNPVLDLTKPIIAALNSGAKRIHIPSGRYRISEMIEIPRGVSLHGDGVDYWDTHRPAPDRLLKSWSSGTHLIFIGTGIKNQSALNLNNVHSPKSVNGTTYSFTEFTNNDSVNGDSATAKLFSVAVKITNSSQIKDLRIMINCDGIDGYNDESNLSLGDEWDVGLWVYDSSTTIIENVQVVGYWRIAGTLLTENDGTYNLRGNPECTIFSNGLTQGVRGLLIRNMPEYAVNSIDTINNTITIEYNPSFTLTTTNRFKLIGSNKTYTFNGYYVNSDNTLITFHTITPALPATALVLRPANIGNNFSGTVFRDYKAASLDHHSKNSSDKLGVGIAGALEISGYPMRNLKFINFKAQTTYDKLNTLFGDIRDAKFISSEHENGVIIAYSISECRGYTGNLRYINSDIQDSCDLSAFNPRDCFIDYKQMPTHNTNGTYIIKNWRPQNLEIQYANGTTGVLLKDDGNFQLKNGSGQTILHSAGSGSALTIYGNNISFMNAANEQLFTVYGGSKNLFTNGSLSPLSDNTHSLGSLTYRWKNIFSGNGVIQTSDERVKQQIESLSVVEKRVAIKLKNIIKKFKFTHSVIEKHEKARIHIGIIAQEVYDVFASEGLDGFEYGILCYDEWDEQPETRDPDGNVIAQKISKGSLYGVRYDELAMFILAAL